MELKKKRPPENAKDTGHVKKLRVEEICQAPKNDSCSDVDEVDVSAKSKCMQDKFKLIINSVKYFFFLDKLTKKLY